MFIFIKINFIQCHSIVQVFSFTNFIVSRHKMLIFQSRIVNKQDKVLDKLAYLGLNVFSQFMTLLSKLTGALM